MSAGMLVQIWTDTGRVAEDWSLSLSVKFQTGRSKLFSRMVYVTRLAYWSARHRSIDRGRWVVEYEGHAW